MTRVILTVLFYLVLTPIAVTARLFGKQFLDLSFRDPKDSYWVLREKDSSKERNYEAQF
jgi:hypothetical protein